MEVCDVILFSTLDVKFMTDERTYSGRPVRLATTLPLLKVDESVGIFRDQIKSNIVNDEGAVVNNEEVFNIFARDWRTSPLYPVYYREMQYLER